MARKNRNEEEVNMTNENVNVSEEMANNENVGTEVPGTEINDEIAGAAEDTRKWYDNDGKEISKSAFIRMQFTQNNLSRKDISENFKIPYRTVYGATVNMENAAEPTSRGRGVTFSKISVTEDNKVVFVKKEDGKADVVTIDGVEQPEGTIVPETIEVDRNTWIKEQVAAGKNRGDIAKALDLSYGVVYGLTKEAEGTRQKYEIEIIDKETGEPKMVSRSEYIRMRVAEGVSKADIAKEMDVEYSVVWQATKKMKTVEEKFIDAGTALEKFMDLVENPEILTEAIKLLGTVKIKKEEADKITETGEANAAE